MGERHTSTDPLHMLLLWERLQTRFAWEATCAVNSADRAATATARGLALLRATVAARKADRAFVRSLEAGAKLGQPTRGLAPESEVDHG
jgi:hypothetical protein